MATPKARQFAGDFRLWEGEFAGTKTPVIPEPTDAFGNQPIETDSLSFSYTAGDETTILSKRRGGRYNQPFVKDQLPGTTEVSVKLLETPTPILARMLFGEAANADIVTGSVSDASFTITALDVPIPLPHRFLKASPAPSFTTSGGSPVDLVAGTDYKLDLRTGTIMILSAGTVGATIDVGDAILNSYSYEAVKTTTILGGATPTKPYIIVGDMEDRKSGEQGLLEVFQVNLGVDGDIDWMSTEPLQPTLKGTALVPDGAPAPYRFTVYSETA
ncbi:MAG: hypothetical protein ACTHK2_04990 [Dokdonella sp.]|uniref:phage tail tube protein n=1 Tax=Dokdonella sp. TaxID=2291710 RepID=UPI003F7CFBDC